MNVLVLDTEAGPLSEEPRRKGIASSTRVHAVVEIADIDPESVTRLSAAGAAFDLLADKPELYTDADTLECER